MTNLKIVRETDQEVVFLDHFEGKPVHFTKDKKTGEITIDADDVCRILGLGDSFEGFLGTDKGLGLLNDWKEEHPDTPFFGGFVRKKNIN